MELDIKKLDNGIKQFKLTGRLDVQGTYAIQSTFAAHAAAEKADILVDISEVEFIASFGMRVLISVAKSQSNHGGGMVLLRPQEIALDALKIAGIDKLIPIYDNFDEACAALLAGQGK